MELSLKNCSPAAIVSLIWCGTILLGDIALTIRAGSWEDLLFNFYCCVFLFLPQWATVCILAKSYGKNESTVHHRVLIALCVLHYGLMLGDMALFLTLDYGLDCCCFISSIVLFLGTGIYLMILRQRWKGIMVALFSLIAWIQPLIAFASHQ